MGTQQHSFSLQRKTWAKSMADTLVSYSDPDRDLIELAIMNVNGGPDAPEDALFFYPEEAVAAVRAGRFPPRMAGPAVSRHGDGYRPPDNSSVEGGDELENGSFQPAEYFDPGFGSMSGGVDEPAALTPTTGVAERGWRLYLLLAQFDERDGSVLSDLVRSAREGYERSDPAMNEPDAWAEFDRLWEEHQL